MVRHRIRFIVPAVIAVLAAALAPSTSRAGRPVADYEPMGPFVEGQIICSLRPGHSVTKLNERWGTSLLDYYGAARMYLLELPAGADPEAFSDLIETDPACAWAEPNYVIQTAEAIRQMVISATGLTYSDFIDQSVFDRIGLDAAHQLATGAGARVAILDTGIDAAHPVFSSFVGQGYDFIDQDAVAAEVANGIDDDGDGTIDEGHGHGTMVAGIVRAVAPGATVLPCRVLDDEGRGTAYAVASAIYWAAHNGADVINMSLGLPRTVESIAIQLADAAANGVVLVAGAGNNDLAAPPFFPASDPHCLMIAAVDSADVKASFSDYHALVFVSAPGENIRSSYPGGRWASGSGCSFATPFVAAEAALVMERYPAADAEEVRARIRDGVVPIDAIPGNEPYAGMLGSGRLFLPWSLAGTASVKGGMEAAGSSLEVTPNPARDAVVIRLAPGSAGEPGTRRVGIYDTAGRLVRMLDAMASSEVRWDGRDAHGARAPSGVYFVRATGGAVTGRAGFALVR